MPILRRSLPVFFSILVISAATANPFGGVLDDITKRQDFTSMRSSSSAEDLGDNGDSRTIMPGDTLVLLDADGPGIITHFWNTIAAFDPFAGRSVVLRVYYDGNEHPSVQVPLGDFFGVGHGANKTFSSLPVTVSAKGLSRTCYWRMPFRKHIKVTVTNESTIYPVADFYYYLDWQKHDSLPLDTMYFHAKYNQAMPAAPGHYTILDTEGAGHYVGTVYSAQQVEFGWFGEGDDFIYIDGSETPQLKGTGTEDYFNDAWGFREFSTPFHGVTLFEGQHPGDRVSAYRWHLMDPIAFKESLRVTIEHRGSTMDETVPIDKAKLSSSGERPDWVSSVGFWYQYPAHTIAESLPNPEKRIAPYQVLPVGKLENRADSASRVLPSHIGVQHLSSEATGFIEFDFTANEAGRYQISGLFNDNILGAIFQPMLDGKKIGEPIDMAVADGGFTWHGLDLHDLSAGTHTLRFAKVDVRGPEMRSIDFTEDVFTIEYLVLLRLEDMEGYHEVYDARKK
jgi:hypothetical protein